ncbi:MAG: hypothetical protein HXY41_09590 [Chloroflexi bacterium]|nr:hypothetical protein [Chloroflexota bacterium]
MTTGQIITAAAGIISLPFVPAALAWIKPATALAVLVTAIMFIASLDTDLGRLAQKALDITLRRLPLIYLVSLALLATWAVGVSLALWQFSVADFSAGGWLALLFLALWPWFTLGTLLIALNRSCPKTGRWLVNPMIAIGSTVLCLLLLEALCQLAYGSIPSSITARMPQAGERIYRVNYDHPNGFRQYMPYLKITDYQGGSTGDMFFKSCLPPDAAQDAVYIVSYTRDEYGFRNPSPWPEKVHLVVLGDSFVYAGGIEKPFWQDIHPSTLGLGMDATSTLEQSRILETYGLPRSPQVIVLAYYEGNDMTGNWAFFFNGSARKGYERWYAEQPVRNFLVIYNMLSAFKDRFLVKGCHWPIIDSRGQKRAFLEEEISIFTVPYQALKQSQFYAITRDAITAMAGEARAGGAQFVLLYIPTKLHACWQSVQAQLEIISAHVVSWDLPATGNVVPRPDRPPRETAALLAQNIDAQRAVIAELAQEKNITFVDLTTLLQDAVANGTEPYFFGDSHWNQTGHDLVRQIMTDVLNDYSSERQAN